MVLLSLYWLTGAAALDIFSYRRTKKSAAFNSIMGLIWPTFIGVSLLIFVAEVVESF